MALQLIDSDAALSELLSQLVDAPAIALDTEFIRVDTFYPKVGLVQICAGQQAWLIDPLAIRELDGLRELLTRPGTLKIMHSASEDIEVFDCWLGVKPAPLYDSQTAAAMLDLGFGLGYRALVEAELGHELSKEASRSDWLARPLSEEQLNYAALDVLYLFEIYTRWQTMPLAAQRYHWIVEEGNSAISRAELTPMQSYTRIKGAVRLNARQQVVLQRLSAWREQRARERDKPRSWIIADKTLLALAEAMPRNSNDLHRIEALSPKIIGRFGKTFLRIVHEALEVPEADYPELLPEPLSGRQRALLKKMRAKVNAWARELRLAPQILLSSKDMEWMLRHRGEVTAMPLHWQGWRREAVVDPMLNWLEEGAQ